MRGEEQAEERYTFLLEGSQSVEELHVLTWQPRTGERLEEALSTRAQSLNSEEGLKVELGRLVNDGEQRHIGRRDIADGYRVRSASDGKNVVVVDDGIHAHAGRE